VGGAAVKDESAAGVGDGDASPDSSGTKFERIRGTDFLGGGMLVSNADEGRGGAAVAVGNDEEVAGWAEEREGETVWARAGGGGGALDFEVSAAAFLFTHRFRSLS